MKAAFDTSALVASLVAAHPMHDRAAKWHRKALRGEIHMVVAAHTLAELYAVLTRLPVVPRMELHVASRLVEQNIVAHATVVPLSGRDYRTLVTEAADRGVGGCMIYDLLVVHAARKAGADVIVTLDEEHFRRCWPDAGDRIVVP